MIKLFFEIFKIKTDKIMKPNKKIPKANWTIPTGLTSKDKT